MKTMKWLLRREFWEHKGALMWAPVVAGSLIVLFMSSIMLYGISQNRISSMGPGGTSTKDIGAMYASLPAEKVQEIGAGIANLYMGISAPLFLMMAVIAFFYCLAALSDERRDRSILFWKSLPVSDSETVLSKVATAAIVAPFISIAVGIMVAFLIFLVAGLAMAFHGVNLFSVVLSNSDFYLAPLRVIGLLPVYAIWALPTIGWLMLVSAWAKSKVFLWAVGTPLLAIVVIKWAQFLMGIALPVDWMIQNVISRGLVGLFPGVWLRLAGDVGDLHTRHNFLSAGKLFEVSWASLLHPAAWLGALAGAAMIYGAMRLRRWKDEG